MRKVKDAGMGLLSEREMQLVLASAPRNITELTQRELKGLVKRTRGMMDKFEQRAHRLRREALGRRLPTRGRKAEGNMNTRRKAALFRTALSRFEARLERLARMESTARRTKTSARKRPTARKAARAATRATPARKRVVRAKRASAPAGYARRGPAKGGARKAQRFPSMKRQTHGAARGRRTQARRDAKR